MELNLRLVLLLIAGIFTLGILFESIRRKRLRKEGPGGDTAFKKIEPKNKLAEPAMRRWGDDIIGPSRVIDASEAKVPSRRPTLKTFEKMAAQKEELNKKSGSKPKPENFEEPDDSALYIASATSNDLIIFYIMAQPERVFGGYELLQTLQSAGLQHGPLGIFHYYDESSGQKDLLFCLASAFEPGTFDIERMGAFSCSGLCLFMSMNHKDPIRTYNVMLDKMHQLNEELNGILCDNTRKPCEHSFLEECKKRVQIAAQKKQDKAHISA